MEEHSHECCDKPPRLHERVGAHFCCYAWRIALIIPALHVLLHLLGLPHPEVLSFLP